MTNEPLVTVIFSCYSHESFFERGLASLLAQTASKKCKILIHDNGCAPSYRRLIQESTRGLDVELIVEDKNTYGLGVRLNVLPRIQTKYVATLHDDDYYLPEKIEESLAAIEHSGVDFVVTNSVFVNAKDGPYEGDMGEVNTKPLRSTDSAACLLFDTLNPPGLRLHYSTLVMRTDLAKRVWLGDPFYPRIADAFFWAEMLAGQNASFEIIESELTAVRIHKYNDRRYDKFNKFEKNRESFLLSLSEINLFKQILNNSNELVLNDFLGHFINNHEASLIEKLIRVSVLLSSSGLPYSRTVMASAAFHCAFKRDPVSAVALTREITGRDANSFMTSVYQHAFDQERFFLTGSYPYPLRALIVPVLYPRRLVVFTAKKLLPVRLYNFLKSLRPKPRGV